MKKVLFFIVLMLGVFGITSAALQSREIAPYCDGVGCDFPVFSLGGVGSSISTQVKKYGEKSIPIIDTILAQDKRYIKASKDYNDSNHTSQKSQELDKVYQLVLSEQSIVKVANKLGIKDKETLNHLQNISLIKGYYNQINYKNYDLAKNLTTGSVKSVEWYAKTYSGVTLYINSLHYRKEKNIYVYKGNNRYYFPVVVCSFSDLVGAETENGQYAFIENCTVYGVTKQIINHKIKQVSTKILGRYKKKIQEGGGEKPVIYFYPTVPTDINVHLDLKGEFTVTYPQISANNTRSITAQTDGTLTNKQDNKEYSYLFREAKKMKPRHIDEGFVVAKKDYASFLQEKLLYLGLVPREYNEFIVYRLPLMNKYPYVVLRFAEDDYKKQAPLTIIPKPDSMQRVFMVFRGLDKPIDLPVQTLTSFKRSGFSVIERGGTEIFH